MEPQIVDTLWLLLCAGLVFLMQPGFMCLESGLTRSKNSIDVAIKNLADFGLSMTLFWAFGYALMYGPTLGGWIGDSRFFLDLGQVDPWRSAFFVFQAMFCGTAVTIVSGAVAERMRFRSYLMITVLISGPIYTVFGHWAWNGLDVQTMSGWLGERGFRDFAGATVVHSVGGWVALAAVLILGPRQGRFPDRGPAQEIRGHNLPLTVLGVFLLWLGWFGFNGGGGLGWSDKIPAIIINTMLSGASGLVAALIAGRQVRGRPDVKLAMNGALAGLVSITGGCHAVSTVAAVAIGLVGGLVMVAATRALEHFRVDDVVGSVPVHAAAGVWGTLALAIFGDLEVLGSGLDRGEQLAVQAVGAGACFLWAFGIGYLTLRWIDRYVALRVTPEEELIGLNVVEHGASTELLELVTAMERQAVSGDLNQRVDVESQSEVGQIAAQYNRVIAALQQAMQDLRDSAERYRRTIDNALDAIITVDDHGVIVGWNPQAEEIFGWSRTEALGQDVFELVTSATNRASTRNGLLSFLTTGGESTYVNRRVEVTGLARDGREFPLEATFTMATHGEKLEFHLFLQDITERQRARLALQEAKEAAEAATRAKSEFLANMSHEIRTPMNGILGMTELMLDTRLSHQQRQYLEMVRASADSLLRLLNDILDFSKIEAGKLDIDALDFNLRDHLADLLRTLAIAADDKGLELAYRVAPEVPEMLVGDPSRLGQVVLNLVANGIKFAEAGEVVVEVRVESLAAAETVLEFVVTDTGIGIPEDKQELIFRVFEQADTTTTRKFGGTGLGLAISRRLVENMGGRIRVESTPGEGSAFTFTARFGVSAATRPPLGDSAAAVRGLPVLVVDDNATNQQVLQQTLTDWGLAARVVDSAARARAELDRADSAGRSYALVISDVHMPEADGFDLVEWIRRSPELAELRVVLMSSGANAGDAERCRELDVDAHTLKPIKPSALLDTITGLFAPGETASASTVAPPPAPKGAPASALVVEDNRINQEVARGLLVRWGIGVEVAANGREALAALAARAFDLVLMDMHMPDMDGFEVTAAIRQDASAAARSVPIVAMTANVMAGDRERCLAAGMDGYIVKPIEKAALADALQAVGIVPAVPDALGGEAGVDEEPRHEPDSDLAAVFDAKTLLRRVDGRRDRAKTLIALFLEDDSPQLLSALGLAVADGDSEAIRHAAHALKGAAAELGAAGVAAAAARLEAVASAADPLQILEKYETLEQAIEQLSENLAAFSSS